jgi:hypothetical protein
LPIFMLCAAPGAGLAALAAGGGMPSAPVGESLAQLTIQQSIIIRMPRRAAAPAPAPLKWKSKKGPKCVAMDSIVGAAVVSPDAIDLVIRGGQRLRAEFSSDCPALDYYSGFYMRPTEDGRVCADRDVIRTRSGTQCEIERFRKLIPVAP